MYIVHLVVRTRRNPKALSAALETPSIILGSFYHQNSHHCRPLIEFNIFYAKLVAALGGV